ncbi:hypothetical protein SEVIR_3G137550v4 [Setaria viridis]
MIHSEEPWTESRRSRIEEGTAICIHQQQQPSHQMGSSRDYTSPAATEVAVALARVCPSRPADRVAQHSGAAPWARDMETSGLGAGRRGRPAAGASTSYDDEGGSYGVSRPHLDPVCTGCACALPIPCRPPRIVAVGPSWSKQQRRQLSLCNLAAPLGPASHGADPQAGGLTGSESKGNNNGLLLSAFLLSSALVVFLSCSLPRRCNAVRCRRHQFGLWISPSHFQFKRKKSCTRLNGKKELRFNSSALMKRLR